MNDITKSEKNALFRIADEIFKFKCMVSIALESLASRETNAGTSNLLSELSLNETEDANEWKRQLAYLDEDHEIKPDSLLRTRVRIMMFILGPRGFLEWVLIAEDESVELMAILAGNIQNRETSDYMTRIVSDERLHLNRMKNEVLGMESWEMGGGGGIRDVIFGANDGLVSILALVAGVYGVVTESSLILISGIAGAIAGTISMGSGAYLSTKSEMEVTQRENERKGILTGTPEQKKTSLIQIYQTQGFSQNEAQAIAERVMNNIEIESQRTIGEVTGLTTETDWPPSKAGGLTGLSFLVFSIVPILPFAFLDVTSAAITAMIASIATLFAIGASKAIFTRSSWIRSGLENMLIGTLAASATYLITSLIPAI